MLARTQLYGSGLGGVDVEKGDCGVKLQWEEFVGVECGSRGYCSRGKKLCCKCVF